MKILVTGANGYIGSQLVKRLCDLEQNVIATDIKGNNVDRRAKFVQADIFTKKENWFSFFGYPDICLHLAWRDGFIHDSDKHLGDLPNHKSFLTNLVANGLSRLAVMGTMHEIGYWDGIVDENTPCNPLSNYGKAKNELRLFTSKLCDSNNVAWQWLRAFYIYGDDRFGNSIFCKIRKAWESGETHFPMNSGENQYDFIHISSLVNQIAKCVLQKETLGIINCCSGKPLSLKEMISSYIENNGINITFDYGVYPTRAYDSPCIYGDSSKIEKILAYNHNIPSSNNHPKISVIIPCYNAEKTIARAIQSAIDQTYRNMEIIIVNSNSTDNSRAIIDEIICNTRNTQIKQIFIAERLGPGANRNIGWQWAKGEYIAFLDADDYWLSEKISFQVELLVKHRLFLLSNENTTLAIDPKTKILDKRIRRISLIANLYKNHYKTSCTILSANIDLRFNDSLLCGEDYLLWNEIIAKYHIALYSKSVVSVYSNDRTINHLSANLKKGHSGELFVLKALYNHRDINLVSFLFFRIFFCLKYLLRLIMKGRH